MVRLPALILGILLVGCQSTGPRFDEFGYSAYSWTGGDIKQMIEAWGAPNGGYKDASDNDLGYARWSAIRGSGSGPVGGGLAYRCEAIAHFDTNRKIAKVEIPHSYRCKRRYGDVLSTLLRPGVKLPPGAGPD